MGWLKRILQGSTSNSRQSSNRSCEVDDHRSRSDETDDTEDESIEGEVTDYRIAHIRSFVEDDQVDDLYGAASTEDRVQDEDERPTWSFQQSWSLESPQCDPANIFQPFLRSFYPNNGSRKQYHGSYRDDDHHYSDEGNDSADELTDCGEETYHRVPHSSLASGEGQGEYLYGAGWATYGPVHFEGSPMQHGDEQLSEAVNQSSVIKSSSVFDTVNIFQSLPFSFYTDNRHTIQQPECIHPYAFDDPVIANHEGEYHSNLNIHYKEHHHHPTCYVCGEPIEVDASGHLQYRKHPFWPAKHCRRHNRDGTPCCFCCGRLKPRGTTYSTFNDGRQLCPECLDSAIMDSDNCKPLERKIRKFYERLDMKVHQPTIPLYVVDRQGIKERRVKKKGHHRVCDDLGSILVLLELLGETRFYTKPIIYTMVEGEQHKLVSYSNVKEIMLLDGCARLYTGETLAHEMMHAWLALEGYHNLTLEEEEGLCQVMAHKWLDSQISAMSKSKIAPSPQLDFERRLAKYLRCKIEARTDNPYGTGFRLVKRATDMYGLKGTLDYIRMTGSFPR